MSVERRPLRLRTRTRCYVVVHFTTVDLPTDGELNGLAATLNARRAAVLNKSHLLFESESQLASRSQFYS